MSSNWEKTKAVAGTLVILGSTLTSPNPSPTTVAERHAKDESMKDQRRELPGPEPVKTTQTK